VSYKLRNSIALGILLFLILAVGTYIRAFNLPKKITALEKEIQKIDEELQNTPNLVNQFNDLSATLNDTQKRWEGRNKDIPAADVTGQTYAYLSHLIDLSGYVKLDMVYAGAEWFSHLIYLGNKDILATVFGADRLPAAATAPSGECGTGGVGTALSGQRPSSDTSSTYHPSITTELSVVTRKRIRTSAWPM